MSWAIATGSTLSSTVTVAFAVLTFPLLSVTVNTTAFGPTFEQSNVVMSSERLAIPQASFEALSISAAVIDTFPLARSEERRVGNESTGWTWPYNVTVAFGV